MKRRWYPVNLLVSFAVLSVLAGCGKPQQPPFEVRNEFDQLIVDFFSPLERETAAETKKSREMRGGFVGATRQFLKEAFPEGTPQTAVIEYFEGIGGSCRILEESDSPVVCEYCRNRKFVWRYLIDTFYSTTEMLWIIEVYGVNVSETPETIPSTKGLAFSVARGVRSPSANGNSAFEPDTCDKAEFNYENHRDDVLYAEQYGELLKRHWVYGQYD